MCAVVGAYVVCVWCGDAACVWCECGDLGCVVEGVVYLGGYVGCVG